jgi:TRAP-type C4-dicarboxylate transport system permease small subunit
MKKHGVFHYVITVFKYLLIETASSIISVLVVVGGYYIYITQVNPWKLVFGIPLMLIGVGLTINFLLTAVLVIFSPRYNRGVCKLCTPISVAKLTKKR